jgi:hypothetical protein
MMISPIDSAERPKVIAPVHLSGHRPKRRMAGEIQIRRAVPAPIEKMERMERMNVVTLLIRAFPSESLGGVLDRRHSASL